MIGFNSRESYQDAVFDIQTQELAGERVMETRIYRNGAILATVRRAYGEQDNASVVREILCRQHERICGKVRDGNYALIFLWISRGIIHSETREYARALECFESVLAIDGDNAEVRSHVDEVGLRLEEDPPLRKALKEDMERQVEELARSGRQMEADRKRAILERLGLHARSCSETTAPQPKGLWRRSLSFPAIRLRVSAAQVSMRLAVAASFLLVVLCVGFIQADTQRRLHPGHHSRIAGEYLKDNQVLPARALYERLLLQDPGSRDALSGFWNSFRRAGDYPASLRALQEVATSEQASPWAHFCLAEAYRMVSRCEEAIPCYQEALRRGVLEIEGKLGWGLCLLDQNRTEEAIRLWEDEEKAFGQEDSRVEFCLGRAYRRQDMPGRASIHFSRALKLNPASPPVYFALADALEAMHQTREADSLRKRAEQLASETDSPGAPAPSTEPLSVLAGPRSPERGWTF